MYNVNHQKMKKALLLLSLFVFVSQLSFAQGRKVYEKAAMDAIAAEDYSAAIGYYDVLLDDAGYQDLNGYYNAAGAAYNFRLFNRAERYYQWANDNGGQEEFPDLDYRMGMTKKRLGKYDEAKKLFEKFLAAHASSTLAEKATEQIEQCTWAKDLMDTPILNINSPMPIKDPEIIEHLDTTINSRYTDIAPLSRNDILYYSSIRNFAGEDKAPFARILSSENGVLATPVSGLGGTEQSVSHTAISEDGSRIYFTICEQKGINKYRCDLYYRDQDGESWGDAKKLALNKNNFTSTHPTVGIDRKTGEELLFFASDRSGGMGGLDIWCSIIKDGDVGAAFNVGAINTASDDITPYFHTRKNTLFFSTDGRKTLGGFDVYKSGKNGNEWSAPVHTGAEVNSSYDEVYLSLNEKGDRAYFSSNRPGGICKDTTAAECVCDDIYATNVPYVDLIVETYNSITREELTETVVTLGKEGIKTVESQGPENKFNFFYDIDFQEAYTVNGSKEGYDPDATDFDTYERTESGTIVKELYLTPKIDVLAKTIDKSTGEPLNGVTVQLVEEPSATLDSKTKYDSNEFDYGLNFKKRYYLIATKPGYSSAKVEVFTDDIPIVPTHLERILRLCKEPFGDFPAIALYFDNDYPKIRKTWNKETSRNIIIGGQTETNYEEVYRLYTAESRKNEYLRAFDDEESKDRVRYFFDEITSNFNRLEDFAEKLYTYLSTTDSREPVVITIKGYASPLAKPAYNELLTERRIYSIEKYLYEYRGGALKSYASLIKINKEPYGESLAQGGSEDRSNKKASIYSVDASQERRVEILNVSGVRADCESDNKSMGTR